MIRGTRRPGGAGRTRGGRSSGAKGGKGGKGGICGLIFGLFLMLTAGLCLIALRLVAG